MLMQILHKTYSMQAPFSGKWVAAGFPLVQSWESCRVKMLGTQDSPVGTELGIIIISTETAPCKEKLYPERHLLPSSASQDGAIVAPLTHRKVSCLIFL